MKKNAKNKAGKVLAVGAAVAAGAAAYALLGPNGKKNRAKVKKVMVNIKNKVSDNKDIKKMAVVVKKVVSKAKKDAKVMMVKANTVKNKVVKIFMSYCLTTQKIREKPTCVNG